MNIDIEKVKDIQKELENLDDEEVIFIDENGYSKYAIITSKTYDKVENILMSISDMESFTPEVKVIGGGSELSYDEYERIKSLIMDAVEKTFKPKAEKLN